MSDWADKAADQVLGDLMDRRGIDAAFDGIDAEIRDEIRETIAGIIRDAAP